jgi:hypothetical protein
MKKNIARRDFHNNAILALFGLLSIKVFAAPLSEIPAAKSLQSEIAVALKA